MTAVGRAARQFRAGDRVFGYTVEDFTASGERYDAVFDTVGRSSFARCRPVLAPRGCYLPTTGLVNTALAARTAVTGDPRVRTGISVRKHVALAALREQLSQDRLQIVIEAAPTRPSAHTAICSSPSGHV